MNKYLDESDSNEVLIIMGAKSLKNGGGAERRFLRLFEYINNSDNKKIFMLIKDSLYDSALQLEILKRANNIIKVKTRYLISYYAIKHIILKKPNVVHLPLVETKLIPLYLFLFYFKKILKVKVCGTVANYYHALRNKHMLSMHQRITIFVRDICIDSFDILYPDHKFNGKNNFVTPCSFTDYEKFKPLNKENIIVFASRLIAIKNPILYLEAINYLKNNHNFYNTNWKFFLMGGGPLKDDLISYVETHNLQNCVIFGNGDISDVLSISKIFVSVQKDGNYPSQSLIEAMACENAIIATDVGNTRLLLNENCSVLIQPNYVELADAMLFLIQHQDIAKKISRKGRELVLNQHSIENFANYCINLWN